MKNLMIVVAGLMMVSLTFGCVNSKVARGVKDNTFYSTFPEIAIRMAPEMEFLDTKKEVDNAHTVNQELDISLYSEESFAFVDTLERRMGRIEIKQLEGQRVYWITDITNGLTRYISTGYEDKQGIPYQYVVMARENDTGGCNLIKWLYRTSGGKGTISINVIYIQQLSGSDLISFGACTREDQKLENLFPEERRIYDNFMKSCDENMQFINIAELDLETE